MAQLPFLVVHGGLVWKLLLVGLVAATYAVSYAIRQRGARKRARAELARFDISSPKKGLASVRGRIKAGTATSVHQSEATFDTRSADLALDCDGVLVELVGPIRVEEAATTLGSWRSPAITDVPRWNASLVRSVAPGDEVIATGVLVEGPAESSSYREAKSTWRMQTDDVIRVLATKPRARAFPLGYAQHIAALTVVASVWFGVLHLVGSRALSRAEDRRATALDGDVSPFSSVAIAAAMPGSRDDALAALGNQIVNWTGQPRSERGLQLQLALYELRGRCSARLLISVERLDQALAVARTCDPDSVVGILALEGRFAEAEHELAPMDHDELATVVRLANGHWAEAAIGADARAHRYEMQAPDQYTDQAYLNAAAAEARCLAALFRSYGGDHDAFAKLDRTTTACRILEAVSRPVAEQAAALAAIPKPTNDQSFSTAGYDLFADEVALASGGQPGPYPDSAGQSALLFPFDQVRVWIAPFQLAAHPDDNVTEIAQSNMVAVAALRGDLTEAHEHLSHVVALHDELALSLAIREGGPIVLDRGNHPGSDEAISLRQGKVDKKIQQYLDEDRGAQFRAALQRAADGDGLGLVAALHEEFLQWQAFALPVLGVLPRITSHREEAMAALRLFRNDLAGYAGSDIPFRAVSDYIQYRDIARLIGDTEDAKQWQTIIDRHTAVFRDRQRLIALVFWRE